MGETCLKQLFSITDFPRNQADGDVTRLLDYSHRKLTHQCLAVGRAFARDNKVGIPDYLVETDGFEQQLYAGFAICI